MRNIEVLRNYYLGKDPQLKETMSDNSLRLCGIHGRHYVLRTELIAKLEALKNRVDAEDLRLQGEIDELNLWKDTTPFVLDSDLATALSNYYTKTQVDNLLSVIPRFSIEVVAQLPTQDISTTTIYLAPSEDPQAANSYDEFIYVNNSWEQIGSTAIDMSDYYTKEEVNAKTFINTLTQDITIPENSELNPLLLSTGWWYTGEHVIYYGENVDPTIHNNALFYFNADVGDQWFYFLPPNLEDGWNQLGTYLWFDNTDHIWQYSGYGVTYIINNQSTDMSIPTAGAVYEFAQSKMAKELTEDVYLVDGVAPSLTNNTLYYTGSHSIYVNGTKNTNFDNSFFMYWDLSDGITNSYNITKVWGAGYPYVDLFYTSDTATPTWEETKSEILYKKDITTSMPANVTSPAWDRRAPSTKLFKTQLDLKQDTLSAGSNITISSNTISATDTTYSAFTGTDGVSAGTSGLVPAPATTDDGKFLCADGTWQTAGGGGTTITYGTTDLTPRS